MSTKEGETYDVISTYLELLVSIPVFSSKILNTLRSGNTLVLRHVKLRTSS